MHYAVKRAMAEWRYSPVHSEPRHKITHMDSSAAWPLYVLWKVPMKKRMVEPKLIWML
jgi:hypothetical protein